DTLGALREEASAVQPARPDAVAAHREFQAAVQIVTQALERVPEDLPAWERWLRGLRAPADALGEQARRLPTFLRVPGDVELWARRLAEQVSDRHAELLALAPWVELLTDPAAEAFATTAPENGEAPRRGESLRRELAAVFNLAEFEARREAWLKELTALEKDGGRAEAQATWLRRAAGAVQTPAAGGGLARRRAPAGRARAVAGARGRPLPC